ncbi:Type I restriction-modification system, specificity subunit S [Listeria monocytogenes FSL J1-208]|uniref:restriction endonuclease subunit S n=1 Tax=Listeria monocytogenes TaxID=1639 RepID=UPI0002548892|nr:restriction endonuclease subunit S [Listeria monocytogenes]EAE5921308.1 restriction endonuclease subunit S [Listeria monocytogenes]EHY62830.1 Type I restriction-modification system, specificity subunit S [Listeria monocytogenes FSL J1-208]QOF62844.1 restriction endonuclease subunit S [Listeria monocytogenes FSL J1-208]
MKKLEKSVPVIRFKGFSEAWEQRKLEELAAFSKGSGYTKNDLVEKGMPLVLYGRLYTKYETIITEVNTFTKMKDKSVISKGNEVVVPSSGETAKDISRASVIGAEGFILGGDLNIIKPKRELNSIFLALTISNGEQQKEIIKRAQGKSVVHVYNTDLKQVKLSYPTFNEQEKIGSFFRQLDNAIALHQRKLDTLKLMKKGFLQQMFPKIEADIPEIRFADFDGKWEQRKLGEVFNERSERSADGELISVTINSGVIKASKLEKKDNSSFDKSNYKVVKKGDIAYNSMRMWQGASGYSSYDGILSPAYTVIYPRKDIDTIFIAYMFKKIDMIQTFQRNSQGLTSDTWNLKFPSLSTIKIKIPANDEQIKITNLFQKLEYTSILHQNRIEMLKKVKKAYLQTMFI